MKNNLISAIAGWKSAALLALVAMVAAVAFSGVLTGNSADAQTTPTLGVTDTSIDVGLDTAVRIELGTAVYAEVTPTIAGSAGAVIRCAEGQACDVNRAAGQLAVSWPGSDANAAVVLTITGVSLPSDLPTTKLINVSVATGVSKLTLVSSGSLSYSDTTGVTITATATNAAGDGVGNVPVSFSTNHGTLVDALSSTTALTAAVNTNSDGVATAVLVGPAVPGIATVTAKAGAHTQTVQVVFYGPAATVTAEERVSAIGFNNQSTFVLVTVKDSGGNPVPGKAFQVSATGGISVKGPSDSAVLVKVSANTDDAEPAYVAADATATPPVTAVYPDAAKSIPACNNDTTELTGRTVGGNAATDLFTAAGTNAKGQCVIHVSTFMADPADPATTTTRGEHTITVSLSPTVSDTATITVGGPADSITSDAPKRVDALSETPIEVTVLDDAGVPVGAVALRIDKVEGAGLVISGATDAMTMTVNGKHTLTYLAPRSGTAVFRVQAGTGPTVVVDLIEIAIGPEPVVEEEPEPEPPAAPENVRISVNADGTLEVTVSPAGEGIETQVQGNGVWEDVSAEAAAPGTYFARARVTDGETGLSSAWTYSALGATVPEPEPEAEPEPEPEPEPPAAPENVRISVNADGTLEVTVSPAGEGIETQVQSNGVWEDVSAEAAAPGTYFARARVTDGETGLSSAWTYSALGATVPEPEPVVEEEVVEEVVIPDLAAPTSVTIAVSDDRVLSVSTSEAYEGDTTESQVRINGGEWADVSEEAAAAGEYQARARFVRGDESTDWVYSSNVVEVPEPPAPPPVTPDAPGSVTLIVTDDGLAIVTTPDVPEGATEEHQLRAGMGEWMAADEVTVEPSTTYVARARFVQDLPSDWVYSNAVATAAAEPEPEPEPEGPPPTWNNELVSGQNLVVWQGEDGADASAGAAEGVTAIWSYNTGSGSWDGYFPGAADVPGGNTLMTLSNGQAYVVIVE